MDIVENLDAWYDEFQTGWLGHLQESGQVDFRLYKRPKNEFAPGASGIDLAKSRLMLITTSGAYLKEAQEPFDDENDHGDYTIRTFPSAAAYDELDYAHTHYDQTAVRQDPQVLMPLTYLRDKVAAGEIGELAPSIISFCGYHPDVKRVVEETIPQIVERALAEKIDGALLVPA